jgi:hypothetical protein
VSRLQTPARSGTAQAAGAQCGRTSDGSPAIASGRLSRGSRFRRGDSPHDTSVHQQPPASKRKRGSVRDTIKLLATLFTPSTWSSSLREGGRKSRVLWRLSVAPCVVTHKSRRRRLSGIETPRPVISRKRVTMLRTVRGAANAVGFSGLGITPKPAWRCSPASTRKPKQRNAS